MDKQRISGHLLALLTVLIWGTTFISTKVLLRGFAPLEILFFRFIIGFAALILLSPHRLKHTSARQELTFLAAGLSGITFYYLFENFALTYTLASNVSIIVSTAPIFTALLLRMFFKDERRLGLSFFAGFVVAIAGILLISLNGQALQLNPLGDLLALLAALAWGCYSVCIRKISSYGYPTMLTTRRIFFYGILFMIPALFFMDFHPEFSRFTQPVFLLNILYLGVGASALCFLSWNYASRVIGALKTSLYIYAIPVVTVIASALILHEPVTVLTCAGTVLTLAGLILSER